MQFKAKSLVSKPDLCSWIGVKVSSQPCSLIFAFHLGAGVDCLISVFLSDKWALNKASLCSTGDPGSIPGLGDPLEKEMATHSSTLAWKIPWMKECGRLQSMGSHRVGQD